MYEKKLLVSANAYQHGAKHGAWTNVGTVERSCGGGVWFLPALINCSHLRTKHAAVLGAQRFVAHAEGSGCAAD